MLKTARSWPTMLALRYFSLTFAGVPQSSFSTSRYHARRGSSASGCWVQNSRSVLLAMIRILGCKSLPLTLEAYCSQNALTSSLCAFPHQEHSPVEDDPRRPVIVSDQGLKITRAAPREGRRRARGLR